MTNPSTQTGKTPGRNEPCPCGSGKKYKKCCGPNAKAPSQTQPADLLPQAVTLFESGRSQEAIQACETMLASQPRNADALHILGLSYFQLDMSDQAEAFIKQSIELNPKNAWAHNNLARVLLLQDRYQEAYPYCQKAIALEPDMAEAHNNLGSIYEGLHKLEQAVEAYTRSLKINDQDPGTLCNLSAVLHKLERLEEAKKYVLLALKLAPDFAGAHNNLGIILKQEGGVEQAIKHFETASSLLPDDPEILCNLGGAYLDLGELDKAKQYFSKALEMYPDSAVLHTLIASLYFKNNKFDNAEDHYKKALNADPHHMPAIHGFIEWLLRQEQWDNAEDFLGQVLALNRENPELLGCKATIYKEQNRFKEAVAAAQQAIDLDPDDASAYRVMAEVYEHFGRDADAVASYQRVLSLEQSVSTYMNLANLEEKRHRLDEALELAGKALAFSPGMADTVHLLFAKIARRQKDLQGAEREINHILIDPDCESDFCCDVLVETGNILDKQGRYDEAFQSYVRAARIRAKVINIHSDPDAIQKEFTERKTFYTRERLQSLARLKVNKQDTAPMPVFIVGFPRSGTTLLEQILVSHPHICAGDELPFISMITSSLPDKLGTVEPYPFCLDKLADANAREILSGCRQFYLHEAEQWGVLQSGATRFTDKMPLNLTRLDLITALFPEAPILHIVRNPMDACLSSLFSNLARHGYACNITHAAVMFRETMELAEHFRDNLDMNYMQLRYEDLVADQEGWSRKIIDFVGEPWDDRCLQFHKTKRRSRTASYEQVTQKIYSSSVARYKNYEKHLVEPLAILEPVMRRYGYLA